MILPAVTSRCEIWTIKKAECQRIAAFELWRELWKRLLRVPWTARRSNQSFLKEISSEYSWEGLMLKLQYLVIWCKELTHLKRPWWWERLTAGMKGMTEDEMIGWHHWFDGHEFEEALRVGDGQGSLACCSPRDCKESETTERLNWTDLPLIYNRNIFIILNFPVTKKLYVLTDL